MAERDSFRSGSSGLTATSADPSAWLQRFVWVLVIATLLLISSGGMVTSKGVGLAVPDWPTTFGYNMFLFPVSQWVGGVLFEHTHRLMASAVGFLTIILAVWLSRVERRRWARSLGLVALAAVILQGVLGGLRVTMLKDEIGIFHACLAQGFFGLLVFIAVVYSRSWGRIRSVERDSDVLRLVIWITALIYLQLALGATMRHQHRDLAILDFPTAYGSWIPDVSAARLNTINSWREARALSEVSAAQIWLQMAHRFVAAMIGLGVAMFWYRARKDGPLIAPVRRLSTLWLLLVACQITLGAWTIWSNKAADVATLHVATGAVMLAIGVSLIAFVWKARWRQPKTPVPMQSPGMVANEAT